ncbi:hypothetical protein BDV98DRAFT_598698 [Pterulicium gracile]|uniref:Uncharacterized protein n=1 Tax=Pterulicium gracile TaxID=1884261 RepID=A0A5C3PZR8_9AGAR|nr:hypothetical protein BDV98DRAFT_598698 [Pterula gracilis]
MKPVKKAKAGKKGAGEKTSDKKGAEKEPKKMGRPPNLIIIIKTVQAYVVVAGKKPGQFGTESKCQGKCAKVPAPTTHGPFTITLDNPLNDLCLVLAKTLEAAELGGGAGLVVFGSPKKSRRDQAWLLSRFVHFVTRYVNALSAFC